MDFTKEQLSEVLCKHAGPVSSARAFPKGQISPYGYFSYTGRAWSPVAGQGIDFIYLLPYGVPENAVPDSVDE